MNILKKEIYNNDEKLMQSIELVDLLVNLLKNIDLDVLDIQAIVNIIDILVNTKSEDVVNRINNKNLTILVPALNEKIRKQIISKFSNN